MPDKHIGWKARGRLLGPAGSFLLHVLIVLCLMKLVFLRAPEEPDGVEVMMMDLKAADLGDLRDQLKVFEEMQIVPAMEIPELDAELTPLAPADGAGVEEELSAAALMGDLDDPLRIEGLHAGTPDAGGRGLAETAESELVMAGKYAARSDEGRREALRKYAQGAAEHVEAAVVKALEWLRLQQNEDGSWGPESEMRRTAMTGLGLLTFLAHGETPSSAEYGAVVEGAIRYLAGRQQEDGAFCGIDGKGAVKQGVYAHAIATYAISEAYALTRIPVLREAMERAARVIVEGQQNEGGWDYAYAKGGRRDTSIAGWQVQALKSAQIAGAEVEGLDRALERAARDLVSVQTTTGRFGYSTLENTRPSLTGVGVLCLQLLGRGRTGEAALGLALIEELDVEWEDGDAMEEWALYAWYYVTQAAFHQGGDVWKQWNREFARAYVTHQNEDGSWTSPSRNERTYGEVYSTTLAALTLQVYYRLLPTYQAAAAHQDLAPLVEEDEDLIRVF